MTAGTWRYMSPLPSSLQWGKLPTRSLSADMETLRQKQELSWNKTWDDTWKEKQRDKRPWEEGVQLCINPSRSLIFRLSSKIERGGKHKLETKEGEHMGGAVRKAISCLVCVCWSPDRRNCLSHYKEPQRLKLSADLRKFLPSNMWVPPQADFLTWFQSSHHRVNCSCWD